MSYMGISARPWSDEIECLWLNCRSASRGVSRSIKEGIILRLSCLECGAKGVNCKRGPLMVDCLALKNFPSGLGDSRRLPSSPEDEGKLAVSGRV